MAGDRDDADVTTPPADMPTLPPGLLERGVVVLQDWVWEIQSGDGRDISRDVNNRFSNHIRMPTIFVGRDGNISRPTTTLMVNWIGMIK